MQNALRVLRPPLHRAAEVLRELVQQGLARLPPSALWVFRPLPLLLAVALLLELRTVAPAAARAEPDSSRALSRALEVEGLHAEPHEIYWLDGAAGIVGSRRHRPRALFRAAREGEPGDVYFRERAAVPGGPAARAHRPIQPERHLGRRRAETRRLRRARRLGDFRRRPELQRAVCRPARRAHTERLDEAAAFSERARPTRSKPARAPESAGGRSGSSPGRCGWCSAFRTTRC